MAARPRMHARDSSGRKVSLLNDEPAGQESAFRSTCSAFDSASMVRSNSAMSTQSRTSSSHIPDLVRADSFDSNNTNDPLSPITPTSFKDSGRQPSYMGYKSQPQFDYREGLAIFNSTTSLEQESFHHHTLEDFVGSEPHFDVFRNFEARPRNLNRVPPVHFTNCQAEALQPGQYADLTDQTSLSTQASNSGIDLFNAPWTFDDIFPNDFDINALSARTDLGQHSYEAAAQRSSTTPSKASIPHVDSVPHPEQAESLSLDGDFNLDTELSSASLAGEIQCTWPSCEKRFPSITTYNHHFKNHAKPFQCPTCAARHATKRHLNRHINDVHNNSEKYYCPIEGCKRSMLPSNVQPFTRVENCKRHMMKVHRFTEEHARAFDMDEETKKIRRERKIGRRIGV